MGYRVLSSHLEYILDLLCVFYGLVNYDMGVKHFPYDLANTEGKFQKGYLSPVYIFHVISPEKYL